MSLIYAESHGELVETLDAQLRDVVRRDGIDPQRDSALVRRLAERIIADHDQRSLTGVGAPVADHEGVLEELVARVSGFGALQRYLDDPTVEEIWINDPMPVPSQVRGLLRLTSPQGVRTGNAQRLGRHPSRRLAGPVLGGRPQVRVGVQRDRG